MTWPGNCLFYVSRRKICGRTIYHAEVFLFVEEKGGIGPTVIRGNTTDCSGLMFRCGVELLVFRCGIQVFISV